MTATNIIQSIVDSFSTFVEGAGQSISKLFTDLFTTSEGSISTLGIVMLSMLGLGIATGITKLLLSKVS